MDGGRPLGFRMGPVPSFVVIFATINRRQYPRSQCVRRGRIDSYDCRRESLSKRVCAAARTIRGSGVCGHNHLFALYGEGEREIVAKSIEWNWWLTAVHFGARMLLFVSGRSGSNALAGMPRGTAIWCRPPEGW